MELEKIQKISFETNQNFIALNKLSEQFNNNLNQYFESGQLEQNGVPSIEQLANKMSVSQRYLSDTLKKETAHIRIVVGGRGMTLMLKG